MKKLRIGVFQNLPVGGAYRVFAEEVSFLSKHHELYGYSLSEHEWFIPVQRYFSRYHFYTYSFRTLPFSFLTRILRDFQLFFLYPFFHAKIAVQMLSDRCDVILVHPDRFTQAPLLLLFLRFSRVPVFYYCHESLRMVYEPHLAFTENVSLLNIFYEYMTRYIRRVYDSLSTRSASFLFTNSRFTQNNINRIYHRDSIVLYPGVSSSFFSSRNVQRKQQVLFIGEKTSENGYPLLHSLLSVLKKHMISVHFVEFGTQRISDTRLISLYAQSKATLCLSIQEPFGMVSVESMASGTPVIAVNEGGYTETVVDGKTGFFN
jgi:glycosyltransferase involved in cell wall biosynthesis